MAAANQALRRRGKLLHVPRAPFGLAQETEDGDTGGLAVPGTKHPESRQQVEKEVEKECAAIEKEIKKKH